MSKPAISVIIATYKAERYIERCARSLFGQTLENMEYIFVDDCTPDKSFEVLSRVMEDFPARKNQVRIIRHEHNMGVSVTRADGMKAAQGEYSIHCDPDDWMPEDACEQMYKKALETGADIVTGRSCHHFKNRLTISQSKLEQLPGIECVVKGMFNFSLWLQIIRTELIQLNDLYPWDGIGYAEDSPVVIRAFALADKVCGIDKVIYHYDRTNESSLTTLSFDKKYAAFEIVFAHLREWFKERNLLTDVQIDKVMMTYKQAVKSDLLFKETRNVKDWYNYWPETVDEQLSKMKGISKLIFKTGRYIHPVLSLYLAYIDFRTRNA